MADREELIAAADRLRARLSDFESDAADAHAIGERADLWTEIEVDVNDLRALLRAQPAGVKVQCERCQGNGEIVTDWERYRHPQEGDAGDEAVAECPDCSGEGEVDALEPAALSTQEAVAGAWDRPIEELARAKAGYYWDLASEVPDFAGGKRDAFISKSWRDWREDAVVEIAALRSAASPVPAEPSGWRADKIDDAIRGLERIKADFAMTGANATTIERAIQTLRSLPASPDKGGEGNG